MVLSSHAWPFDPILRCCSPAIASKEAGVEPEYVLRAT
jgi:hypothetical protein